MIKDTEDSKGNLQFGTEVITSDDGSLAALLGASPGASTAVDIMLDVLKLNLMLGFRFHRMDLNLMSMKKFITQ